jgi:hypothetical protein
LLEMLNLGSRRHGALLQFSQGLGAYCDAQRMPNTLIRVRFRLNLEFSCQNLIGDTSN